MRFIMFFVAALLAASVGYAETHTHTDSEKSRAEEDVDVVVEPHQAVVQVNGVVCSFCAYGAEKSLAKLDCLDAAQFGNGVLIDINTHRITLAMAPGTRIPLRDIHHRIKKAGYDPVAFYLRVSGTLERSGAKLLLRDADSGQVYSIVGESAAPRGTGESVEVQVHVDGEKVATSSDGEPVSVVVDRWISEPAADNG